MFTRKLPLREHIYSRVVADPESDCLIWTGAVGGNGYGSIWIDGRQRSVHRVIWEVEVGAIPDGYDIDHVRDRGCVHRTCVNVAHLEPVTKAENGRRRGAAVTACRRSGHPLTESNTYRDGRGERACKACRLEATRRWRERRRASA